MPELDEDRRALGMDGIDHRREAHDLRARVDARHPGRGPAFREDARRPLHDEPDTVARVLDEVDRVARGHVVTVARPFEHRRAVEPVPDRRAADRDRGVKQRLLPRGRDVHRLNGRTSASGTPSCRRACAGTPGTSRRDRPRCAAFGGTMVASRVMRSIASVSVGCTAPAVAPSIAAPSSTASGSAGTATECRARPRASGNQRGFAALPPHATSRSMRRPRRGERVDDVARSHTRAPAVRRGTSTRGPRRRRAACTPATPPRELRIGERRAVAEDVRLPVAVVRSARCRSRRPAEPVEARSSAANGSSPSAVARRMHERARGRGTRRTRRCRLRAPHVRAGALRSTAPTRRRRRAARAPVAR